MPGQKKIKDPPAAEKQIKHTVELLSLKHMEVRSI